MMTLRGFRVIAGVLLAGLVLSAGNYYFEWGFFGSAAKLVMILAMFLGALLTTFMPAKVDKEMQAEREAQLAREEEWERTRDKSNDEAETAQLRKAIGLPPNTSLERTRDR